MRFVAVLCLQVSGWMRAGRDVSKHARELICRLLKTNPVNRLGARTHERCQLWDCGSRVRDGLLVHLGAREYSPHSDVFALSGPVCSLQFGVRLLRVVHGSVSRNTAAANEWGTHKACWQGQEQAVGGGVGGRDVDQSTEMVR
eukprot:1064171-Rhodomonas_salina.1